MKRETRKWIIGACLLLLISLFVISVSAAPTTPPAYESAAAQVVSGTENQAVLGTDGHVYVVGDYLFGCLGTGYHKDNPYTSGNLPGSINYEQKVFHKVETAPGVYLSNVQRIYNVGRAFFAIDTDGHVWGWGANESYMIDFLTSPNADLKSSVVYVPRAMDVTASWNAAGLYVNANTLQIVGGGLSHILVIDQDGQVWSWGRARGDGVSYTHTDYRLGYDPGDVNRFVTTPQRITAFTGKTIVRIGAMTSNSYALDSAGNAYVWGRGGGDQVLEVTVDDVDAKPFLDMQIGAANAALVGNNNKVYMVENGVVFKIGSDYVVSPSTDDFINDPSFAQFPPLLQHAVPYPDFYPALDGIPFVAIRTGGNPNDAVTKETPYLFAKTSGGNWSTCGTSKWGQTTVTLLPSGILPPTAVTDVNFLALQDLSVYFDTGIGIGQDGKVYTWGWNSKGQLGRIPTDLYRVEPVSLVAYDAGWSNIEGLMPWEENPGPITTAPPATPTPYVTPTPIPTPSPTLIPPRPTEVPALPYVPQNSPVAVGGENYTLDAYAIYNAGNVQVIANVLALGSPSNAPSMYDSIQIIAYNQADAEIYNQTLLNQTAAGGKYSTNIGLAPLLGKVNVTVNFTTAQGSGVVSCEVPVVDAFISLQNRTVPIFYGFGGQFNQQLYAPLSDWYGITPENVVAAENKTIALGPQHVRVFYDPDAHSRSLMCADGLSHPIDENWQSFEGVLDLAQRTGAEVNVQYFHALVSQTMEDFANIIYDYRVTKGYTCIKYVSLFNEPNGNGILPNIGYETAFLQFHNALTNLGIRDQIKLIGGDLVSTNQLAWFTYMAERMNGVLDAYSMHPYWDYWDTAKPSTRLSDVEAIIKAMPDEARKPIFVEEFGVRGYQQANIADPILRDTLHLFTDTGTSLAGTDPNAIEAVNVIEKPLTAYEASRFTIEGLNRGYSAFSQWDIYRAKYDSGWQDFSLIGRAVDPLYPDEPYRLRPGYYAMETFIKTADIGWQVYRGETVADKQVVGMAGPSGEFTAYVAPEYRYGTDADMVIGGLLPNTTYNVLMFNELGTGAKTTGADVTSDSRGIVTVHVPKECFVTLTTVETNNRAPVVTGVLNATTYNAPVTITFDQGTATLNGANFVNGTTVSANGSYTLVVTGEFGQVTTVNFTIGDLVINWQVDGESLLLDPNCDIAALRAGMNIASTTRLRVKKTDGTTLLDTEMITEGMTVYIQDYGFKVMDSYTVDIIGNVVIEGVTDTLVYNSPRTITITGASTITLNGEPFVSGTTVSAVGTYTLVADGTTVNFQISAVGMDPWVLVTTAPGPEKYLKNIQTVNGAPVTTAEQMIAGFTIQSDISAVQVKKTNGSLATGTTKVGTGMVVEFLDGASVVVDSLTLDIVIYGDITGDGVINAMDLLALKKRVLGQITLEGAFLISANCNKDGTNTVNAMDLLALKKHILGQLLIAQS